MAHQSAWYWAIQFLARIVGRRPARILFAGFIFRARARQRGQQAFIPIGAILYRIKRVLLHVTAAIGRRECVQERCRPFLIPIELDAQLCLCVLTRLFFQGRLLPLPNCSSMARVPI
jgi:hypothetical protein